MNDNQFSQLVESIQQAGGIRQGTRKPSRVFTFSRLDIKLNRAKLEQAEALEIKSGVSDKESGKM